MRASSVYTEGEPAEPSRSLSERVRDLPVAIQGMWLGLVCIVLLLGSAASLRSLAGGVASALTPTAVPTAASGAPVLSAPALPAAPVVPSSTSLSIGGPSTTPGIAGFGVLAIRDRLPTHIRLRKIGAFLDDLERLLEVEPSALERADVRKMIADAATYSMTPSFSGAASPDGERVFAFLTGKAGSAGPDILFELVTTRGGSRAASYAESVLRAPEVRARGTPAFNIAYDLRVAPNCQARTALLERAKTQGDKRVLQILFQMARCGRGPTECCLANDPRYKEVVRVVNAQR